MDSPEVADVIDYEKQLMAGLIPSDTYTGDFQDYVENLLFLMQTIDINDLKQENAVLLQCMDSFRDMTDGTGVMDEQALLDMLVREKAETEIQVKYTELYAEYARLSVSKAKFRFVVARWIDQLNAKSFVKALNDAYTIKNTGMEVDRKKLLGFDEAKTYLLERLHDIESGTRSNFIPEGDIREETEDFLVEMEKRKEAPEEYEGLLSGFTALDNITNGAQVGELVFICGYTEVGKTFFCLNWAHHANTHSGKNVVIGTSETPRPQLVRRANLLHCRNNMFGLPQGIDADSFKRGRLSPQEEEGVKKAMNDFGENPNYGKFEIFQIPEGADLPYIQNKLNAINTKWLNTTGRGVELFVLDSLNHLQVNGRANEKRTILNERIKRCKHMAVNFDRGRGIPIISPWHANRSSWKEALQRGHYDLSSWEEANELEKSADILLWLLKLENSKDTHEILAGLEKYRDGKAQEQFTVYEDFASSYMGTVSSGNVVAGSSINPPASAAAASATGQPYDDRSEDLF